MRPIIALTLVAGLCGILGWVAAQDAGNIPWGLSLAFGTPVVAMVAALYWAGSDEERDMRRAGQDPNGVPSLKHLKNAAKGV